MKNIKYNLASDSWGDEEINAIHQVIKSNRYTMGPKVKEFENQFAEYFNSKYALMVNSGSTANLLMVASLILSKDHNLNRGDEVIVPSVSWSTTYYPLSQYGLKLRFVDVDLQTLNIDTNQLEKAISDRTRAIMAVNLLGNPCNFTKIKDLCLKYNLLLIEDNCESLGAKYNNVYTGTMGNMGSFSFFFSHHMQTMEGGMILTNDQSLLQIATSIRAHGWIRDLPAKNLILNKSGNDFEDSFKFVLPGYGVRPLEMSGAIGIEQLKKVDSFINQRKTNAELYKKLFLNEENVIIQKEVHESSWFGFSMILTNKMLDQRNKFIQTLEENMIESRPIVAGDFTKNPVISYLDHSICGNLENSEIIDKSGFFIGNDHRDLSNELNHFYEVYKKYEKGV